MSAPKTPEGRAQALAKRRENTRPRSIVQLRQEAETVVTRLGYYEGPRRPDVHMVSWAMSLLVFLLRGQLGDDEVRRLAIIKDAIGDLRSRPMPYPHRQAMAVTVDTKGLKELTAAIQARLKAKPGKAPDYPHESSVLGPREEVLVEDLLRRTTKRQTGAGTP